MPVVDDVQHSPYTPEQLFALVLDVEKYPQFLPWCRAARILERKTNEMVAELVVSFAHITERYTSRITWQNPDAIDVALVKGPFDRLTNIWRFRPENGGTEIRLHLDFEFKSKILRTLISAMFARASQKMMDAFKHRAEQLYAAPSLPSS